MTQADGTAEGFPPGPGRVREAAGPLAAAAAVVAGALAGEHLRLGLVWLGATAAAVVAVTVSGRRRAGFLLVGLAAISAALTGRALDGLDGPVARLAEEGRGVTAAVRLVEDPRARWREVRVLARVENLGDGVGPLPGAGTIVAVTATGSAASRLLVLSAGETALVEGALAPLGDRAAHLRWRHAAARLRADDLLGVAPASGPHGVANRARGLVMGGTRRIPAPDGALVAGLLVGDDRHLPRDVAEDFRRAGLSHLLAVSGANVALTLVLARPLLGRLSLTGRLVAGLAVIGLFATATRFEPSVLRASLMAGLALLAAYLGRPAMGLRVLGLAVTGLVLADPFLVHSVGFALSVGASAGILVLGPWLAARLSGPRWWREAVTVTAAAQAGAAPVALAVFGSIPLVAVVANAAAAPAAAAVSLSGIPAGLAAGMLEGAWPAGADAVLAPTVLSAAFLRAVASVAARVPVEVDAGGAVLAGALTGAAVWVRRWRRRVFPARRCPAPPR